MPVPGPTAPRRRATVATLLIALTAWSAPAAATPFRDALTAWSGRLDAAAAALDTVPHAPITEVGPGPLLRLGASGERVERLRRRLTELGLLVPPPPPTPAPPSLAAPMITMATSPVALTVAPPTVTPLLAPAVPTPPMAAAPGGVFDAAVDAAVRSFQATHGLKPDGLVGGGTRAALDRSPMEAAALMRQSANDMRAFRDTAPDTVLYVNLPSQMATLVRDGVVVMRMRAIVGRPSRETPMLQDEITHVVVNPTWTVPPTVLRQDKLPMLRAKGTPGITDAVVYLDGEPVDPATVDWNTVSPRRIRIVQMPGDHNALGRFRFNMTNGLDIYLHGTNEPKLFDRELRTVSSGCVRLQDPRGLAETLLGEEHITPQRIDRMLEKGTTQWIRLATPLPVRFVYWTATVDDAGAVRMHPDIYDLIDEDAAAANAQGA